VWHVKIAKSTNLGFHVAIRAAVVFATVFLPAALLGMLAVSRTVIGAAAQTAPPGKGASIVWTAGGQVLYAMGAWALVAVLFASCRTPRSDGARSASDRPSRRSAGLPELSRLASTFRPPSRASIKLAGSLVAGLLWLFFMAQIMLAGARLAYEHACLSGRPIEPRPWAELYEPVAEDQVPESAGGRD